MRCSVEGCTRPMRCKGMCNMHYRRVLSHGDTGSLSTYRLEYLDACGAGTQWGCGQIVDYPAVLVLAATPPVNVQGPVSDNGSRLFHPECKPEGTRPAFMDGLLAEIRSHANDEASA